jgi:hypothetical protein
MTPDRFPKPAALFSAPGTEEVVVEREAVEGLICEGCGGSTIERYPVLRVGGWKRVTRCRDCLLVIASEDAPTPMGFTYVSYGATLRHQAEVSDGDRPRRHAS